MDEQTVWLAQSISRRTDRELLEALLDESEQYQAHALAIIRRELTRRGYAAENFSVALQQLRSAEQQQLEEAAGDAVPTVAPDVAFPLEAFVEFVNAADHRPRASDR